MKRAEVGKERCDKRKGERKVRQGTGEERREKRKRGRERLISPFSFHSQNEVGSSTRESVTEGRSTDYILLDLFFTPPPPSQKVPEGSDRRTQFFV